MIFSRRFAFCDIFRGDGAREMQGGRKEGEVIDVRYRPIVRDFKKDFTGKSWRSWISLLWTEVRRGNAINDGMGLTLPPCLQMFDTRRDHVINKSVHPHFSTPPAPSACDRVLSTLAIKLGLKKPNFHKATCLPLLT